MLSSQSEPASVDSLGQSNKSTCFVVIWCRGTFFKNFFSAWSWQVQTLRPRLVAPIRPGTASIPAETKWPGLQPDLGWNPRSFWAARIENGLDSASFRPIPARFQSPPPTLRIQSGSTRRGKGDGARQAARSWAMARGEGRARLAAYEGSRATAQRHGSAPAASFSPVNRRLCLLLPLSAFLGSCRVGSLLGRHRRRWRR